MPSETCPIWQREEDASGQVDFARMKRLAEPLVEDLRQSFRFDPDTAEITLNGERMVLTDNRGLGSMRRELIAALGYERARGVATRMGYGMGAADAQLARSLRKDDDVFAGFAVGPQLHALKGSVKVEPIVFRANHAEGSFYSEYYWHNSAECCAHRDAVGIGPYPGGWQQVGYASGYASAFFGRPMIFRELQCIAMGHERCFLVGKPAEEWENADEEARWFRAEEYADRTGGRAKGAARAEPSEDLKIGTRSIVGASAGFNLALHLVDRVARTRAPVLFTGESGVGKEVFARELHKRSDRAEGPLIAVNCAAIPETLIEAELFGVERGAYTGADGARAGRFERAEGGTLFLDEIATLSPGAQAKLLRVLQESEFERVGASKVMKANVRLIAATNDDLHANVAKGLFRADLLHRITTFPIHIPPLRDRREDIPLLANHFLRKMCKRHGRTIKGFTDTLVRHFHDYRWPGNVREMENLVERAVILANDGEAIDIHHLTISGAVAIDDDGGRVDNPFWSFVLDRVRNGDGDRVEETMLDSGLSKDELVDVAIAGALRRSGGNVTEAAQMLKMSRSQLNYWIRKNSRDDAGSGA
ncbi:sigma-54-dependent Fis family transcriptional regulator [Croceicoccus mobilis]|uniref:Sigma-54-dependent Fis family transcriptional regulator n=1 Tax=Croceicoccus mobilis TaxID=1703339 RepID=A0A916Z3T1_9SPHN|nr:sigma-54-dependent Fis family transcriptional regulator [Croceicoccus mobilis]GGD74659.1 sigma-54-dependent Fis family transcriptional regulator [Croceicoccus mobilis]